MTLFLILGNQLFSPAILKKASEKKMTVFMREDAELCTYFKFHKHKIIFFLAAMRHYARELHGAGLTVHYEKLGENQSSYEEALASFIRKNDITKIICFEIEDKFFEKRLFKLFSDLGCAREVLPSPMFLTGREEFKTYLKKTKRPFMKVFYEDQRKRLNILVDGDQKPVGGRWSFDEENRLALPASVSPPPLEVISASDIVAEVQFLTAASFPDHPGLAENFWLPVTRSEAHKWLLKFIKERLPEFGPYEDALALNSDFVFHSVLTPFLNTGLLTPKEVVQTVLEEAKKNKPPLSSLEGFIRQIIGWRELIRGIYQNFSEVQESSNFFQHKRKLTHHWYDGTTGIAPLDHVIKKANKFGHTHHIERLMVVGSLMNLLEIAPVEAHRWFMEMHIDSSDWVMGPNVYGMALFSDGGIFATKPYICGSNYYRKMGGYKASENWCEAVDGLYWGFIEKHQAFFLKNPRLSMMARSVEKMDPLKKQKIFKAAEALKFRITC